MAMVQMLTKRPVKVSSFSLLRDHCQNTADVVPGLDAGPNYCQSHILVDTWMLTVKAVYKL